jgi:hypothetical protein
MRGGRSSTLKLDIFCSAFQSAVSLEELTFENPSEMWNSTTGATLELVFAPAARDVYSDESTNQSLAPLGAKPGSGTIARAGKGGCGPTELQRKEKTCRL